jgi:hypothetical protein
MLRSEATHFDAHCTANKSGIDCTPIRREGRLAASGLLLEHRLVGSIFAVHLEDGLGEINPDRANLHVDGPLMVIRPR